MLTLIRNMLRTRLAGLLFLLIIIAMGAWGVTDVFSGNLGNNLAAAGDVKFSEAQLDQEVERELRTATDERGRALSKAQASEQGMVDQIYQRELFRTALVAYADRLGAVATDEALVNVVRNDETFQGDTGTFDPELYRQLLRANGFTPDMFERFLRRDLTINWLTQTAQAGLQPPLSLTALQAAYSGELRKASWFVLSRENLPEPDPVTDEDIAVFYEEQQQALTNPPRRAISLVHLTVDDFMSQAEYTEDDLQAYYDAVKGQEYTGPDTRTWTEFVFRSEEEARDALGRIAGGAAPASLGGLANSAERTGKRSSMSNTSLADRVFGPTAQPGGIFGPVQTGNFYTVARLESIEPGEAIPFEEVRDQIVDEVSREQAIGLYYDSISQLDGLIGTGADLEQIAEQMGTPVLSFAPVDRSGVTEKGLAPSVLRRNPDILSRAFELTEGGRTPRFGQDESAYMLRVDRVVDAFTPPLEDLREDLRTVLERQRQSQALTNAAQDIKKQLEASEITLEEAAAQYGATTEAPDQAFTRRASETSVIPPAFVPGVFSLKREGDVHVTPTEQQDEIAVVQLVEIDRPTPAELRALAPVSEPQMRQQLNNDLLEAFVASAQDAVNLEVNPQALEAYKARINPDT
ncbi:MAG: SurA N-terminal domain-containing protein [Henriciella sp.]|uniref:SurA N-terminal domain-containing protein n=1 Tax=Henriciella sp. TaxID=1968823 RepID=UPI0032EC1CBD